MKRYGMGKDLPQISEVYSTAFITESRLIFRSRLHFPSGFIHSLQSGALFVEKVFNINMLKSSEVELDKGSKTGG